MSMWKLEHTLGYKMKWGLAIHILELWNHSLKGNKTLLISPLFLPKWLSLVKLSKNLSEPYLPWEEPTLNHDYRTLGTINNIVSCIDRHLISQDVRASLWESIESRFHK